MSALHRKIAIATLLGASVSAAVAGCSAVDEDQGRADTQRATASSSPSASARNSGYADGTYRATGWYGGLPSSIDVTVTLDDDVITDVEVTPNATVPTSLDYQERFAEAVPDVVVGRNIDEVRVSRLAGSSGTPDGFNDALDRIKAQAAR
ncbi:hypothetical protein ABZ568_09535 [Streptomyces olindensis]|uniref:FMN-binding domain-containing protein n=1 Tax=Streptomyces olindensis TaxID=358823 RepID=A0ABV2XS72_9ACTN